MSARTPEECDTILVDAINNGDLETAIALYEPNARFVQESGEWSPVTQRSVRR